MVNYSGIRIYYVQSTVLYYYVVFFKLSKFPVEDISY